MRQNRTVLAPVLLAGTPVLYAGDDAWTRTFPYNAKGGQQ